MASWERIQNCVDESEDYWILAQSDQGWKNFCWRIQEQESPRFYMREREEQMTRDPKQLDYVCI